MKSSTLGSIPANRQIIHFKQVFAAAGTTNVDGTVFGDAPARGDGRIIEAFLYNARTILTDGATTPSTLDALIQRVPASTIADPTVTGVPVPITLATGLRISGANKKMVKKLATLLTEAEIVGVATAGGGSTVTIAAVAGMIDGQVVRGDIEIVGGTGVGQKNSIVKYIKSTEVVTVKNAWTTNPASGSIYRIKPRNLHCMAGDSFQCVFDFTIGTGGGEVAGADAIAGVVLEFDENF